MEIDRNIQKESSVNREVQAAILLNEHKVWKEAGMQGVILLSVGRAKFLDL